MADFYAELDRLYADGGGKAVEQFLRAKMCEMEESGGKQSHAYMICVSELAGYLRGVSRYDEAIEFYLKAIDMIADSEGISSLNYATTLNNAAGAYRMKGDYDNAEKFFLETMRIYEILPDVSPYLYAGALNNISVLYRLKGMLRKAIECQIKAIELLKKDSALIDERATSVANLASLHLEAGDKALAEAENDEAMRLFEELPYSSAHYSAALCTAAVIKSSKEEYEEAKILLAKAEKLVREMFGENADYAKLCMNLGSICFKIGDHGGAEIWFTKATGIFERIFGKDSAQAVDARAELARMGIGNDEMDKRVDGAGLKGEK